MQRFCEHCSAAGRDSHDEGSMKGVGVRLTAVVGDLNQDLGRGSGDDVGDCCGHDRLFEDSREPFCCDFLGGGWHHHQVVGVGQGGHGLIWIGKDCFQGKVEEI